ncbi:IS66 family transposase [Paracraurococcus lichenis]|uniref:IS66 family transposase n=1 Tax=Paracraurococcus lichenis TaxID=3064888 RepID=UPI00351D9EF0
MIRTGDTAIRVLAPGRGRTRIGRFRLHAFDPRPWGGKGPPAAISHDSPDRKGERPRERLAGHAGWLHADAYATRRRSAAERRSSGGLARRR